MQTNARTLHARAHGSKRARPTTLAYQRVQSPDTRSVLTARHPSKKCLSVLCPRKALKKENPREVLSSPFSYMSLL